jgi:hypothetical protein
MFFAQVLFILAHQQKFIKVGTERSVQGNVRLNRQGFMFPFVCRCCGSVMARGAFGNPNICATCAEMDLTQTQDSPAKLATQAVAPVENEWDQFLEWDGPTMVECVNAAEQARLAIAEAAAWEAAHNPPRPKVASDRATSQS